MIQAYINRISRDEVTTKYTVQNTHRVPKLLKVTINTSIRTGTDSHNKILKTAASLELMTLSKPCLIAAKKSVSNFGVKIGNYINAQNTLTGGRMYTFLLHLVNNALTRAMSGTTYKIKKHRCNYSVGIRNIATFPFLEFEHDKNTSHTGMDVDVRIKTIDPVISIFLIRTLKLPVIVL